MFFMPVLRLLLVLMMIVLLLVVVVVRCVGMPVLPVIGPMRRQRTRRV